MPRATILVAVCAPTIAIDPSFAANITVYHINPLKYGPKPINMDSGDAAGDMFFDLHNGYIYPLQCPHGAASGHSCANPEVVDPDLMVNKVILEVDTRYSGYARCNVGINGSASGVPCEDETYCCSCSDPNVPGGHGPLVPCNATLGCENILKSHGGRVCSDTSEPWQCYKNNVAQKFTPDIPGYWYSSLAESYCDGSEDYYSSACTWRVVSIPKIVTKQCHADSFLGIVEDENHECFDACGTDAKNTSSVCWAECFYETVLGPDAGKAGGAVAGMDLQRLLDAWLAPFDSEDPTRGGCPNMASQMTHGNDILIGFVKGFLSETDNVAHCQTDTTSAGRIFTAICADIKNGNFAAAIGNLSFASETIQSLVTDCEPVSNDAQYALDALAKLSPERVQENLRVHSADIFEELSEASRCMNTDDYEGVGNHLGVVLRKVILSNDVAI